MPGTSSRLYVFTFARLDWLMTSRSPGSSLSDYRHDAATYISTPIRTVIHIVLMIIHRRS
jgi:hypothetical protein